MKRVLMLVLVLLLAIPFASAQDDMMCFGLSAEDCEVINNAYANLDGVMSFYQTFGIDFSVTGVPDAGALTFNVSGEGAMAMDMEAAFPVQMTMPMSVAFSGPDGDGAANVEVRIVEGIVYVNMGDGQWIGVDAMEAAGAGFEGAGLPMDLDSMMEGDMGDMGGMMEGMDAIVEPAMALMSVPGFLSYTRDGDSFNFVADFAALFTAEEFTTALEALGEAAGDPSIGMIGMMAPMLMPAGTMTVTQNVNPDAQVVDRVEFTLNATVDGSMLDPNMTEPIVVSLVFWVEVSDLNGTFEFVAPEGAQMMPMGGM